ncbi:MAG: glycosyltransferase family 4 protein [Ktedonobacteraceae bacterium]
MPRSKVTPAHESTHNTTHIIFVCQVFFPDTSATSILFTDLFVRLAESGTQITVLTGYPSKDAGEQFANLPRREHYQGIDIVRCGIRVQSKRNLLVRVVSYGCFLAHAGIKLLHLGHSGRVVGGTDPPFTSIALCLLSWLRRFTYEEILLDIYPDGLVALGNMHGASMRVRAWLALNRWSYQSAERVMVIGRDMAVLVQQRYKVEPEKIVYVPHWATSALDAHQVTDHRPIIERLGLQDKFVVQYSGNMGLWHDIDALVRAAEQLQDDDRIHFLFIGKGCRRAGAEKLFRQLGLINVTWMDFLPTENLLESLVSCDAALVSLRENLEGVAVPSKLYGILASGRPVIAQVPLDSEVAYVVNEQECGIVVLPGDVNGLAAAIKRLASDPSLARTMGSHAREAYESRYTIDHAVGTLGRVWRLAHAPDIRCSPARWSSIERRMEQ